MRLKRAGTRKRVVSELRPPPTELELELGLGVLLLVLAVGLLGPELQQMFAMRENKRADCLVVLSLLLVVGTWY